MRLLLVEDEDRIASFVQKGLAAHGYTIERVVTGREGISRALSVEFDLLVLDLGLPDMDGHDVLRTRRVAVGGRAVELAPREFSLLDTFLRNPGQVLSREQLLSRVWGYNFDPQSNLVDVYV